jgi:exopolyphosphatase/guanosine-5'-triphosphate,3'-diphosphate pyrophosphatase
LRAAVDCGTNSFRLLITDADNRPVVHELRITRLGEGVHEHRAIQPSALERAVGALAEFGELIRLHGVQHVRAVATSAARDATNGEEFLARARSALGVELEVLSGRAEGELTFKGAAAGVDAAGPMLVVDIGGGSTEFAFGVNGCLQWARSLDLGSVRLTELYLRGDPYDQDGIRAANEHVRAQIATVDLAPLPPSTRMVGVAGTVTTLAMIARSMPTYEPDIVHGLSLGKNEVDAVSERLLAARQAERLAIPGLPEGRADVIAAGSIIFRQCFESGAFSTAVVSERDLLWGLLE